MAEVFSGPRAALTARPVLALAGVRVFAPERQLLRDIWLDVMPHEVLAVVGPSGAGKSTLLKTLNRMVELETPPLRVEGEVTFDGTDIYGPQCRADEIRERIGIVFQQPVVFPRSIVDNTVFGLRRLRRLSRRALEERAEEALREAGLWKEVKDRLREPAHQLSIGQQQRLCLARCLAVDPSVVLMDEPTSSLDPRSTSTIEALIDRIRHDRTVVLVTHDLAQAKRLADRVACICIRAGVGELVETAGCCDFFDNPQSRESVEYLRTGEPA